MTSWKNNNVLTSRRFVEEVLNPAAEPEKPGKIVAKNKEHLRKLIEARIREFGPNCDLNDIDVSQITDMSGLFKYSNFNGDISQWDVSDVENMHAMFFGSKFNGDISQWNVSKVTDMRHMFDNSPLKGNEPDWYKRRARLNRLMLNPKNL